MTGQNVYGIDVHSITVSAAATLQLYIYVSTCSDTDSNVWYLLFNTRCQHFAATMLHIVAWASSCFHFAPRSFQKSIDECTRIYKILYPSTIDIWDLLLCVKRSHLAAHVSLYYVLREVWRLQTIEGLPIW
jgi:hypothetical protein